MRILFAGTPEIAVPSLELLNMHHEICGVLTNPDRPAGRGRKLTASPVKTAALELGLKVIQPGGLGKEARNSVRELQPQLLVVVAFSRIFGPKFLSLFPMGGINLHPSLLPKYRGPSPINAAIVNGDAYTGITVQQLALEMDAGDILLQEKLELHGDETAKSLTEVCSIRGSEMLLNAVNLIEAGKTAPTPQNNSEATYCTLLQKNDGEINWFNNVGKIEQKIRGLFPWPGSFTYYEGKKLMIINAAETTGMNQQNKSSVPGTVLGMDKNHGILIQTGQGILGVTRLQLQSKKAMDHVSFVNGVQNFFGTVLGGNEC